MASGKGKLLQTMKKNKTWLGVFVVLFTSIAIGMFVAIHKFTLKREHVKQGDREKETSRSYFYSLNIASFTADQLPLLTVQLYDQQFPLMLDLGYTGFMSLSTKQLDKIEDKKSLGTRISQGFRGKKYVKKAYELPELCLDSLIFYQIPVTEVSVDFQTDSVLLPNSNSSNIFEEEGSFGWRMFENTNLLLDLKNGKIGFCDSLETLKKEGQLSNDFIKTELYLNNDYLEIVANTDAGPMHCMLDTGTTWNLLNIENPSNASEEMAWDGKEPETFSSFKVGEQELGSISFFRVLLRCPCKIDAVLGMDFFREHVVFLDFLENCAYIAKAKDCPANDDPS